MTDIQTRMIEDDYLKVVEENMSLSEANAELVAALGALLRPYGPVDIGLSHAPANDLKAFLLAAASASAILAKHEARDA